MKDRQQQIDFANSVRKEAETLIAFFGRHGDNENEDVRREVASAISHLIDYGTAVAEGRVRPRPSKPAADRSRMAVIDGGRPKD